MEKKITVSRKKAKKLTVSRKKAKILTVNRKNHYQIETLNQSVYMKKSCPACHGYPSCLVPRDGFAILM